MTPLFIAISVIPISSHVVVVPEDFVFLLEDMGQDSSWRYGIIGSWGTTWQEELVSNAKVKIIINAWWKNLVEYKRIHFSLLLRERLQCFSQSLRYSQQNYFRSFPASSSLHTYCLTYLAWELNNSRPSHPIYFKQILFMFYEIILECLQVESYSHSHTTNYPPTSFAHMAPLFFFSLYRVNMIIFENLYTLFPQEWAKKNRKTEWRKFLKSSESHLRRSRKTKQVEAEDVWMDLVMELAGGSGSDSSSWDNSAW